MSRLLVRLSVAVAAGILCSCAHLTVNQTGLAYYVATDGDDADAGARGAPFATLERARDAVRGVILAGMLPEGGVTVYVRGGRYYRTAGLVLSGRDSGSEGRPVVYRAFPGEQVRLVGGRELPRAAFRLPQNGAAARLSAVSAGQVFGADLRALGLADVALPPDRDSSVADGMELYYGKRLLQRLRLPNEPLDACGEWWVDGGTGTLYVWPPAALAAAPLVLAALLDPIVTLDQSAFVTWQGFTMENTQGVALAVKGGRRNRVVACTIRNTGAAGITVSGSENGVSGCDIEATGSSGIDLDGGDRLALQVAGNYADNNYIHHLARRSSAGAIRLSGVGNRATHNLIHDVPRAAIVYGGNEHLIEANEIMRACLETADAGALYTGRDWGTQGNTIRGNFIHHIGGVNNPATAVYLDDCGSGNTIEKNVVYRAGCAVFIAGGRYNRLTNNVFVDCVTALRLDDRGRQRIRWNAGPQETWDLQAGLEALNYRQPPWSDRYPYLVSLLADQAERPLHNTVERNVCVGGSWLETTGDLATLLDLHDNLLTTTDPGFVAVRRLDLRFRADSVVWTAIPGLQPIPLHDVGVYRDPLRASWPVGRPVCVGGLARPAAPTGPGP